MQLHFFRFAIKDNIKHQNKIVTGTAERDTYFYTEKEERNPILDFILISFSLIERVVLVAVISGTVYARFVELKLQNKTMCLIH